MTRDVLLGCALYYGVLVFNLLVTFWIGGESLLGLVGVMMFIPVTISSRCAARRLPGPVLFLARFLLRRHRVRRPFHSVRALR